MANSKISLITNYFSLGTLTSSHDLDSIISSSGVFRIFKIETSIPKNAPNDSNVSYSTGISMFGRIQRIFTHGKIYIRRYWGNPVHWTDWYYCSLTAMT